MAIEFVVPTPLVREGTIYSNGFFFVQSILADRYIHRREIWVVSLKSSFSLEFEIKKIFLNFVFFEGLLRIEVLSEHVIFGMISFTFSVIFLQIMIFSLNFFIQNYISRHKRNQFLIPNTQNMIKRLVLVLKESLL